MASDASKASLKAADDAADQIAAVERGDVDSVARRNRFEGRNKLSEASLLGATELFCRLDRDRGKAQRVARPPASDNWQVGRDDRGNFGVAAGRLVIGEQQDRLARAGDLDRAGHNRIRDDIPAAAMLEEGAVKAHAHPVGTL